MFSSATEGDARRRSASSDRAGCEQKWNGRRSLHLQKCAASTGELREIGKETKYKNQIPKSSKKEKETKETKKTLFCCIKKSNFPIKETSSARLSPLVLDCAFAQTDAATCQSRLPRSPRRINSVYNVRVLRGGGD